MAVTLDFLTSLFSGLASHKSKPLGLVIVGSVKVLFTGLFAFQSLKQKRRVKTHHRLCASNTDVAQLV